MEWNISKYETENDFVRLIGNARSFHDHAILYAN